MAQIYGQIESLKQIRQKLNQKGIDRFNSVNQINKFLANYESEQKIIYKDFENDLALDLVKLKQKNKQDEEAQQKIRNEAIATLDVKIDQILSRIDKYNDKIKRSWLAKVFAPFKLPFIEQEVKYLQINYDKIISKSTVEIERTIIRDLEVINEYIDNKEEVVRKRSKKETKQLAYTREVVTELYSTIAGAIGENLVVKEIEKLSDDYILINDFSVSFYPPIYNKKDNDRIYSIQIDHLLISKSGVFILETKNWSEKSIKSLDLRSPIQQISRTSFALFVLINNNKHYREIRLNRHHWGSKQIPIRSVIVMINQKPKEDFKFVKVKTLNELNSYVTYFEPVFSEEEVESVAQYFINLNE